MKSEMWLKAPKKASKWTLSFVRLVRRLNALNVTRQGAVLAKHRERCISAVYHEIVMTKISYCRFNYTTYN